MKGEQQLLFVPARSARLERLWAGVGRSRRRKVVTILAEMGRAALVARCLGTRKEGADES